MSRFNPHHDPIPVYEAASHWCKQCLLSGGSVFEQGQNYWSQDNVRELRRLFVENPLEGTGTYMGKLQE